MKKTQCGRAVRTAVGTVLVITEYKARL
jgi:hypothetical protein